MIINLFCIESCNLYFVFREIGTLYCPDRGKYSVGTECQKAGLSRRNRDCWQPCPLMISTTFVLFQTSTSFSKFSKKLLPPAFNLTCLLTLCLLLFNLLTGSFILLKLLFSKFTMTSSLRWIVVRSLHSFFSTYLLPLILSIIPSFLLVFKIGSILMVFLLIGSHLISHLALRQSRSMIPSLHSLLFPVVYPKVPYLAHSFSLSILLLLAR